MRRFIVEREIPAIGSAEAKELAAVARTDNETVKVLGRGIQWIKSYIAADKTYCEYLAVSEEILQEHAQRSGFPADNITEITAVIDPTTAGP